MSENKLESANQSPKDDNKKSDQKPQKTDYNIFDSVSTAPVERRTSSISKENKMSYLSKNNKNY